MINDDGRAVSFGFIADSAGVCRFANDPADDVIFSAVYSSPV